MRICVCVRRRRLPCPKTRRVSRRKMPSPLNSNRPVDVSFEEEKRLLALFDLCLQAIREEKDSDNLTLEFKFELEKSQLDEESRVLLSNLFDRAVASELSEHDYVDFITILQKNSPKELNDDERDSLRRLEFLLALAVEKTRIKVYASIAREERMRMRQVDLEKQERLDQAKAFAEKADNFVQEGYEFVREFDRSLCVDGEVEGTLGELRSHLFVVQSDARRLCKLLGESGRGSHSDYPASSTFASKGAGTGNKCFKTKVLWDILGDARPRTLEEFMRVLRDKGILPRVSA